jgi:ribosomal protein L11 methylase PrmA
MNWIQLTVETTQDGIDPVCAALDMLGIDQFSIVDSVDEIERFLGEAGRFWDYVDYSEMAASMGGPAVRAYLDDTPENQALVEQVRARMEALRQLDLGVDPGSLRVTSEIVDDTGWNDLWKRFFVAIPVGQRLLVQPAWEPVPSEFSTGFRSSAKQCDFRNRTTREYPAVYWNCWKSGFSPLTVSWISDAGAVSCF